MDLGERKRKILQAVIDDYIATAEPVGSRTIAKKHELGLSSATIRNEMADLEDMGLLMQPHTSAGRVPSQLGYRIYVDDLMKKYKLSMEEIARIRTALEIRISEIDSLIKEFSNAISGLTKYAAVVLAPDLRSESIRHIELVYIDKFNILLVIVTSTSLVKSKTIRSEEEMERDFIHTFSNLLNDELCGQTLEEIENSTNEALTNRFPGRENLIYTILDFVGETLRELNQSEVYVGGSTNILNYPEYNDIVKAREFLEFLNEKHSISKLLEGTARKNQISIKIGRENVIKEMQDSSMVVSTYSIGNRIVGNIGIIGPTRMDYPKVVSSLELVTNIINDILMKTFLDDKED